MKSLSCYWTLFAKYVKIVIPHKKGNKGIMLQSVYKLLTKKNKVCEKYIFVPGLIVAKIIVENSVSKYILC